MSEYPVIDLSATGQNIERLRRRTGLSVRAMQESFGFSSPQAIYKWQRGECMPTLDNIVALAAVFGVTVDEIIIFQENVLRVSA